MTEDIILGFIVTASLVALIVQFIVTQADRRELRALRLYAGIKRKQNGRTPDALHREFVKSMRNQP